MKKTAEEKTEIPVHKLTKPDVSGMTICVENMEEKLPATPAIETHRHDYYEIFIFEKGGGQHFIDFENYVIDDNAVHFISPGQVHHLKRKKGSHGNVVMFSPEFFSLNNHDHIDMLQLPFFDNHPGLCTMKLNDADYKNILPLFLLLKNELSGHHRNNAGILQSLLKALLLKMKMYFEVTPTAFHKFENNDNAHFTRFKRLLEENFTDKHLVSDYAMLLNISAVHLNDICKRVKGQNAGVIIKERLLLEAKRLLMHSTLSQKEIAYELNFQDPPHFHKFFKNHTGLTPNEFCSAIAAQYK